MNIAIWGCNSSKNYSGGRIHAWFMAEALANNGNRVTFFTNNKPVFYEEYNYFPSHKKIDLLINPLFNFYLIDKKFDLIIWVPHLKSKKSFIFDPFFFYKNLLRLKKFNNCPILKLDFESPNWITSIIPQSRKISDYKYQTPFLHNVDVILSSTKTGHDYAKKYYTKFKKMKYHYCMPPINSICADSIPMQKKEKKITIIIRFSDAHKHPVDIIDLLSSDFSGYTINMIIGKGSLNADYKKRLLENASKYKCTIRFLYSISEKKKYTEIKKSILLLFFTKFEGFGLPPIEAQYCGTQVICSNLPVLKEINRQNVIYIDNQNLNQIKTEIKNSLNNNYNSDKLKDQIHDIANFNTYSERLKHIIKNLL